ncbi:hypothetical protein IW140_002353 [Coemansia sp. RSA 1813]|nr:hypothetical protein EV178_002016 [Coemansia sp. RSA 1646]KAJ1771826.1 hypothetical protein LPJ74_002000 [Coemansia sp. RSA 1843]KAJ2090790.1 hypothetical protein IW138_002408 [Coemansia sp. RSA 986]KAJ2216038.1 hypothetical protein EV179_001689 [Coemansia sp. RSA 487]KAJ2570453.1 hypothetical protein IW140_002353 [Coemansia sp. RSA 1813]
MPDVVIVTGASKGIGRQVCVHLLATHADLIVVATARSATPLLELQAQTDAARLIPVVGDITSESTQHQVIHMAKEAGRVCALVNNAARMAPTGRLLDIAPAAWQTVWATNFMAAQVLIHGIADHLVQGGARIVNVTSSTSQGPVRGFAAYGTTKVALNYLTQAIALEYPQITAVAFYPGVVDTAMNKDALAAAQSYDNESMGTVVDKLQAPIPVQLPATIIANLAMRANPALSGKYLVYSDAEMASYST